MRGSTMRAVFATAGAAVIIGLVTTTAVTPAEAKRAAGSPPKHEAGVTALFNGKDLTGWKVKKSGDSLDGKTEAAGKRFTVDNGELVIDPKVKGDVIIETAAAPAGDLVLKFEWQPGEGCNNDIYLRGIKFDLKKQDVANLKQGEWNTFEFIITGDQAELKNNGESVKKLKTKGTTATPFGLRAEFGALRVRNLTVKTAG